jgi:hypothetical protein
MVANFPIDRPALLEINRKIATMGGGDYHLGEKRASLCWIFVRRLSVFGCSPFPPEQKKLEKGARLKKKNGGNEWTGPPILSIYSWGYVQYFK